MAPGTDDEVIPENRNQRGRDLTADRPIPAAASTSASTSQHAEDATRREGLFAVFPNSKDGPMAEAAVTRGLCAEAQHESLYCPQQRFDIPRAVEDVEHLNSLRCRTVEN
jgi:hypothetical protein